MFKSAVIRDFCCIVKTALFALSVLFVSENVFAGGELITGEDTGCFEWDPALGQNISVPCESSGGASGDTVLTSVITLNKNGGSGGTSSVTARYGYDLPDITLPTRSGYTFDGYYSERSGGTRYYIPYYDYGNGEVAGLPVHVWDKTEDNYILYAHWTACNGTGEIVVDNKCICDASRYYYGTAGNCQLCDVTNGAYTYVPEFNLNSTIGNDSGKNYAYIDNDGNFYAETGIGGTDYDQSFYGLTSNNTWAVYYDDEHGMVTGQARCSTNLGVDIWTYMSSDEYDLSEYGLDPADYLKTYTTDELGEFGGGNCYCNITEYNSQSTPSLWVLIMNGANDEEASSVCASICATYCADRMSYNDNNVYGFLDIRHALFDSASIPAMCKPTEYGITYELNGGTNYDDAPISYTYSIGETINGKPRRTESTTVNGETVTTDYIFVGWCKDSALTDCATTQTIPTDAIGTQTLYAKWEKAKFWMDLNIPDDNKEFEFMISAAGTFYVDCGADGRLSNVNNEFETRIYHPDNMYKKIYKCIYSTGGTKTINFAGEARGYNTNYAAISFNHISYASGNLAQDTNIKKITGIYGSLGSIFKSIANPENNTWASEPAFFATFAYGTNIEGEIPSDIFSGITGTAPLMFYLTFYNCSQLTGLLPDFSQISGSGQDHMFDSTFSGCSGLKGSVPNFKNIVFNGADGENADYMFYRTFSGCSGLNGTIPSDTFAGIKSTAPYMFCYTFYNCSQLTDQVPEFDQIEGPAKNYMFAGTFEGCSGLSGSIPNFKKIVFNGTDGENADHMFYRTFYGCSGLDGTIPSDTFAGIKSTAPYMFYYTFYNCSQLTDQVPEFDQIKGPAKNYMFASTFSGCSGLSGSIPNFKEITFNGTDGESVEYMFYRTFYGCSGLDGTIPSDTFAGIKSTANGMFSHTFGNCSQLTGSIPDFSQISGPGKDNMFHGTFVNCKKLTGDIPSFKNITGGTNATNMFRDTFIGCSDLDGKIPRDAFEGITSVAPYMFYGTFSGCSKLKQMPDADGVDHEYIDALFMGDIYNDETDYTTDNVMTRMFNGTGFDNPCPAGTYEVKPNFGTAAGKPWCSPCPENYTSEQNSQNINQCYRACPDTDASGEGTLASDLSGYAYYAGEGVSDDISQCKYRYNIIYMDGNEELDDDDITPKTYVAGVGAEINYIPTKTGYTFTGWCTDSDLSKEHCATSQTIPADAIGTQTFYAKWEAYKFSVTTKPMDANDVFKFNMSAKGIFYVDCGDDGTLSSAANDISADGITITRSDTTDVKYMCTYPTAGSHTIRFGGTATQYSGLSLSPDTNVTKIAAIRFGWINTSEQNDFTPEKIASISGSLGQIFPTLNDGSDSYSYQPRFTGTFSGASNLTSLPVDSSNKSTLFDDVRGGTTEMFQFTFRYAGLTSLPSGLFAGLTGANAMFDKTFQKCTSLTDLPGDLFADISGAYIALFMQTFSVCSSLTTVPETLFDSITGNAERLFSETFSGAGLTSLPTDDNGNSLLFKHISGSNQRMFNSTFGGTNLTTLPKRLFNISSGTAVQQEMFAFTFKNTKLTSLPDDLFVGLTGSATNAFYQTFYGSNDLTTIRSDLFADLSGGAESMFQATFYASGVNSIYDVNTGETKSYIPGGFMSNITTFATNLVANMFYGTGLDKPCPANTYEVKPEFGASAKKPWCSPCPDDTFYDPVKHDGVGATSQNQCCAENFDWDGTTCVGKTVALSYIDSLDNSTIDTEPQMCTYGENFNLPPAPTRPGFVFAGWEIIE